MSFDCLIEPYVGFLTLIISHIARACLMSFQVEPFFISLQLDTPFFIGRGPFPECRYPAHVVLALRIGIFYYLELACLKPDTRLLLDL